MSTWSHPSVIEAKMHNPLCGLDWDRLVMSHADFSFFHSTAWAKVLSNTYGHTPFFFQLSYADKSLALLPVMEVASRLTGRRGVSLPFSDFCRPLISDGRTAELLIEKLLELGHARKWRYFELRGGRETLPAPVVPAVKFYGHRLNLAIGVEELFARFQGPVRRAIRKAEKSGLAVEISNTRAGVIDFYRLHVRTRTRHGAPPQPLLFFLNIYEEIIKPNLGFVILAKSGTRLIAGAVFFHMGETALYKFGASDERAQEFRGNNLVMWEGIKRLVRNGLKTLHLGRSSLDDDGLRRFKLSWGTEEEVIEYFRFALRSNMWVNSHQEAAEFPKQLFRRLPLPLSRLAGSLIYPHLD